MEPPKQNFFGEVGTARLHLLDLEGVWVDSHTSFKGFIRAPYPGSPIPLK